MCSGKSGAGAVPGGQFSLAHDPNDKGGRIKQTPGGGVTASAARAPPQVPGFEFVAPKTGGKKKRAAGKKKGEGEGEGGSEEPEDAVAVQQAADGMQALAVSQVGVDALL